MRPRLACLLGALTALLVLAPAAGAASLHIADAEVTVAQGDSASFTISLTASGALTCRASATVAVDSLYSLNAAGEIASGDPADVTFSAAAGHGSGNNCVPTWDGAPDPYALAATVTTASDTPLGDYTAPINYEVLNSPGTGPAGKLSNAGSVNVTIHVVAPTPAPTVQEPAVTLPEPEQEVLGVRAPAPRPQLGKSVMLTPVSGKVVYRRPGAKATLLTDVVVVPNGTIVDAGRGVVKVTVERDRSGTLDSADAWGGAFVARQAGPRCPCITTFTLAGQITTSRASAAVATAGKRLLWVNGKGNFKTRGKRASAIVRGTFWLTEDTPGGTKVAVKRGAVAVRDFTRGRTVLVTAGHSYTAPAHRATIRRVPAFTGSVG